MDDRIKYVVDLDAIKRNIVNFKTISGGKIMAIVKANCYGLGALPIARAIENFVDFFGVATLYEGIKLRVVIKEKPILILGYISENDVVSATEYNLSLTIYSYEFYRDLSKREFRNTVKTHLAIDTGMCRIGIPYYEIKKIDEIIDSDIKIEGIFSHLSSAGSDMAFSLLQIHRFLNVAKRYDKPAHLLNSAGIANIKNKFDLSRLGIGMYGKSFGDIKSENVLKIYAKVISVKNVRMGDKIGYDGTFFAERNMKIAVVGSGYADGIPCELKNQLAFIDNFPVKIVGKICMDYLFIDVSFVPFDVTDKYVEIFGGIIDLDYLESVGIFPYSFLCGLGKRGAREYLF